LWAGQTAVPDTGEETPSTYEVAVLKDQAERLEGLIGLDMFKRTVAR